jgi:extradiol dioxygenase family protein
VDHLAIPVSDRERSRRFYVSVKCRDPDGYIIEASWEPEL